MQNLLCSTFLTAALATACTDLPTKPEGVVEAFPGADGLITTISRGTSIGNLWMCDRDSGFTGKVFLTCPRGGVSTTLVLKNTCKTPADILVELSSSKSKIWTIDSEIKADGKVTSEVYPEWDGTSEEKGKPATKGLGGACNTSPEKKWSTDEVCEKHINDIKEKLVSLLEKYSFKSVRFLATAGVRQMIPAQRVQTMTKLKEAIDGAILTHMPSGSTIEYRPLSGEEEAENEFLSMRNLLSEARVPFEDQPGSTDRLEAGEPLAVIGFGGGSLQYGMLTPAEAEKSASRKIHLESTQGGLDKIYLDVTDNKTNTYCKTRYGPLGEGETLPKRDDIVKKCSAKVKEIASFSKLPLTKTGDVKKVWKDVKVYVVGGINYAIRDHFGKMQLKEDEKNGNAIVLENVWDYTLKDLKKGQDDKCKPFDGTDRKKAPAGAFKKDKKKPGQYKANTYFDELCFKYTYLIQVLKEFGIPEGQKIHFRAKVDGKYEAQWVPIAVMKEKNPDSDALRSYDTETITREAKRNWEALQQEYAAPETLI